MTRNYEDACTQKRVVEIFSKVIVQCVAEADIENSALMKCIQDTAKNIMAQLADLERTDRCWYCYATKELGTEKATGLTQCLSCAEYT